MYLKHILLICAWTCSALLFEARADGVSEKIKKCDFAELGASQTEVISNLKKSGIEYKQFDLSEIYTSEEDLKKFFKNWGSLPRSFPDETIFGSVPIDNHSSLYFEIGLRKGSVVHLMCQEVVAP